MRFHKQKICISRLINLSRRSVNWLKRNWHEQPFPEAKPDVTKVYGFVLGNPFGEIVHEKDIPEKTINWVIPDFGIGSGGHLNIFRMIKHLECLGYKCRITLTEFTQSKDRKDAKARINNHFMSLHADVYSLEDMPPAYFTFATAWSTAYAVRDFRSTIHKCYFVQDFEPDFYAKSTESVLAEQTYRFGFYGFTAGEWLKQRLTEDYGMNCTSFSFSYDKDLYNLQNLKDECPGQRLLFYSRPPTPRRGFELGFLALEKLLEMREDLEVVMAGWDVSNYRLHPRMKNVGLVDIENLPSLYQQCDAALILSFTNVSLTPLELMASGCVVISNRGSNVEWLLTDENSILTELDVNSIVGTVDGILSNREQLEQKRDDAKLFALKTDWFQQAQIIAARLEDISAEYNDRMRSLHIQHINAKECGVV